MTTLSPGAERALADLREQVLEMSAEEARQFVDAVLDLLLGANAEDHIWALHQRGISVLSIARQLDRAGLRPPEGGRWSAQQVAEAVRRRIGGAPLEVLGLSPRPYNCLWGNDILTVEQLESTPDEALLKLRNFGRKSLVEARTAVRRWRELERRKGTDA